MMHLENLRRYIVLLTAITAILITYGQLFSGLGQSQAQLSASGDSTIKVAGFAFSIWSIIFAGVLVYAVYQFLPSARDNALCQRFAWPTSLCFTLLSAWVVASAMDWKIATVVLIFAQLIALLVPLWICGPHIRQLSLLESSRTMLVWPISFLAGWLTIAAPLNLITVATALGALPSGINPDTCAITTVIAVVLATLTITARIRTMVYCIPVAWGLLGAYFAEQARNSSLANVCLSAAAITLIIALLLIRQKSITRPLYSHPAST